MGFFEDFWGKFDDYAVGPTAPAYWLGGMGEGADVQPPLTPEASQAAAAASKGEFDGAPVSASATDDTPAILGYEDIPGFDPATDAPYLTVGKKTQASRAAYTEKEPTTAWASMTEDEKDDAKELLFRGGYYGSKVPLKNGMHGANDVAALKKAMTDANLSGVAWRLYIKRAAPKTGVPGLPGTGAGGSGDAGTVRADRIAAASSIRAYAYNQGIRLPDEFVKRKADQIAAGHLTADEVANTLTNKFVARSYPAFEEELKAGMTMRDLAAPYIASYASLLEVPEGQVDLQDPLLKRALQGQDDKGNPSYMPVWKFEEELKQDKRWQYTDNAWDEVGSQAYEVMRMFGMQA